MAKPADSKKLSPSQENILYEKGTEAPGTSKHLKEGRKGIFSCVGCSTELFSSEDKFNSMTGWPSFSKMMDNENVVIGNSEQGGHEVTCKKCGGHLGHVFSDRFLYGKKKRFCINGDILAFNPDKE